MTATPPAPDSPISLPLQGIRVIDFCVVWAGPYTTLLLADLGAEVVKVENVHRMQPSTRGRSPRPDPELLAKLAPAGGGYPNDGRIARPWNVPPTTVNMFGNKYSCTIELKTAAGREAFERLVRISDVFYENNVPETTRKFGLGYDYLRSLNPSIIVVNAPAYASSGPYSRYRAFGVHSDAVIGHSLIRRYPGTDPSTNTDVYPADYMGGVHGAFAVIAALEYRRRTGKGQLIEHPLAESSSSILAEYLMDCSLNRRVAEPIGNRDLQGAAPAGVFPTLGEDRWIAISVLDDEDWQQLSEVCGRPEWMLAERFATNDGRREAQAEIEALLAGETRLHAAVELAHALQERGVPAGPVLDAREVTEDEHVQARGALVPLYHPDAGNVRWPGPPWKFRPAPVALRKPPVTLGEDNAYIYRDLLGYSQAEYDALEEAGDIGTEYSPAAY